MSHTMTASPKPSFRAPWRVGYAVVGRGNAGWTTSKSGHPCPCQNRSQGPPAEKTARGSLLNRLSRPPDDPIGQGTELNWTNWTADTDLHFATTKLCKCNSRVVAAIVRYTRESEADDRSPNHTSSRGWWPIILAMLYGFKHFVFPQATPPKLH